MRQATAICLGTFAAAAFALAATTPIHATGPTADDPTPCVTSDFKTDVAREACAEGGQDQAKRAMKDRVKAWKAATGERITCKTCHESLTPKYELKDDAFERFESFEAALGGGDDSDDSDDDDDDSDDDDDDDDAVEDDSDG